MSQEYNFSMVLLVVLSLRYYLLFLLSLYRLSSFWRLLWEFQFISKKEKKIKENSMKQKFYRFLMPVVFAQQILYGPPSMREPTRAEKISSVFNIVYLPGILLVCALFGIYYFFRKRKK